jgi:type IV secretion system protein VirB6
MSRIKRRVFVHFVALSVTCLIFDQTKDLFKRWLMYGIGAIFSMALLSVVASMVLGHTVRVSAALWGAKIINSIMGNSTEGLTSVAMQQGGIGLLLSILIVSVPPMAAMFFQGTLRSALTYAVFQGAGSKPGPQGQPAGPWGERPNTPSTQQYGGRWKVAMKAESLLCAVSYLALLVGCAWL